MNRNGDNKAIAALREMTRSVLGGFPHPGGGVVLATVTQVKADTLMVKIGNTGTAIEVLKPYVVCPAFDVADGYTYAYTTTDKQTRTSTVGSSVETQLVTPAFFVGVTVEIAPAPAGVATYAPALSGVKFQVVNHPAMWDAVIQSE